MHQLNFDSNGRKSASFRDSEKPAKKSYKRDYSSLSQARRNIDRIMEERALARELQELF